MNKVIDRVSKFQKQVFPRYADLYGRLANNGQSPKALMVSCADSRIVPELILQADPGDLFVIRNAGNIVPPFSQVNGGVSSSLLSAMIAPCRRRCHMAGGWPLSIRCSLPAVEKPS